MQQNGSQDPIQAIFWRDEILQVMFWLRGEGLEESVRAQDLAIFLNTDAQTLQLYLEQTVADGYLLKQPDLANITDATRYTLSALGRKEGGRRFHDEFSHLQKSGHGECSADCSCHQTGDSSSCPSHGHQH
jgi:hypothetical protein